MRPKAARGRGPFLAAIAGSSAMQLEHGQVDRLGRRAKHRIVALQLEAGDERPDVGEVEFRLAPVDGIERPEAVLLDRRRSPRR